MIERAMIRVPIVLMMALIVGARSGTAQSGEDNLPPNTVRLDVENGVPFVKAAVRGSNPNELVPVKLRLDTSGQTILKAHVLEKLGIDTSIWKTTSISGVAADAVVREGPIAELEIAGQVVENLLVQTATPRIEGWPGDGSVGTDFLLRFHVTINERTLRLESIAQDEEIWKVVLFWDYEPGKAQPPRFWEEVDAALVAKLRATDGVKSVQLSDALGDVDAFAMVLARHRDEYITHKSKGTVWYYPLRWDLDVSSPPIQAVAFPGPGIGIRREMDAPDLRVRATPGSRPFVGPHGVEQRWKVALDPAPLNTLEDGASVLVEVTHAHGSLRQRSVLSVSPSLAVRDSVRIRRLGLKLDNNLKTRVLNLFTLSNKRTDAVSRVSVEETKAPVVFLPCNALMELDTGRYETVILPVAKGLGAYFQHATNSVTVSDDGKVQLTAGGWSRCDPSPDAVIDSRYEPKQRAVSDFVDVVLIEKNSRYLIVGTTSSGEQQAHLVDPSKPAKKQGLDISTKVDKSWLTDTLGQATTELNQKVNSGS